MFKNDDVINNECGFLKKIFFENERERSGGPLDAPPPSSPIPGLDRIKTMCEKNEITMKNYKKTIIFVFPESCI